MMSIIILGLGESGYATAKYCAQNKIPFEIIDTRANPPNAQKLINEFPGIQVHTGGFHAEVLKNARTVVLSPGIAKDNPDLVAALPRDPKLEIIGDIEFFARAMSGTLLANSTSVTAPIISITGSNGKSTVTTLVGEMAKAAGKKTSVGGNLGIPAMALLKPEQDLYVLELSSFQLETTHSLKSKVATLLNICPDHMDRYKTLEDYLDAKARIFQHCEQIVMNRQEPLVAKKIPAHIPIISFGTDPASEGNYGLNEVQGSKDGKTQLFLAKGKKNLLSTAEMKLFGRHNAVNALAALALGDAVNLPMDAMLSVLREFKGLPHRCEWLREHQGITWINDSKGTNVGATIAAIEGLGNEIPGKWILIAGGISKNADFTPLKAIIQHYCRAVVLIGEAAAELHQLLIKSIPLVLAQDLQDAVQKAAKLAQEGDGVLLSPACASFDMFKNFEDRGEKFRVAVQDLR